MDEVTNSPRKPRADRGDGSVKQILTGKHKGKWRVRLTYRDKWNRKQDVDKIVATQKEGKALLKQVKKEVEDDKLRGSKDYTLGQWFDWLNANDWQGELKANTISNRVSRFEKYVRPTLGEMPLSAIRPLMAKSFFLELKQIPGIGTRTVQLTKSELVNILNKAIAYEVLDGANPFSAFRVETPELRKGVALTPESARISLLRLLSHTNRGEFELWGLMMIALALGTGMRRGELLALTEEQLHLDDGFLIVDRAVTVLDKGQQEIDLPKKNKVRTVVLAPTVCNWIRAYLEATKDARSGSRLLFPNRNGKPKMVSQQRKVWYLARKLAKFPPEMVLHDCRLTHNNWIEKLLPEVPTSTRLDHMGHAAQDVNTRNYTREILPSRDQLRNSLEKLFTSRS